MASIDQDTFTRGNQSGWGTASGGSTYTFNGTTQSAVASIVSNQGKVTNTGANTIIWLGSTTCKDGIISVRQLIDHVGGASGVVFRSTASNTYYKADLHNGNTLEICKLVSGTETILASSTSFTYGTSDEVWIKLRVQGTSLAAKVWLDGNSEPDWTIYATDSTITAVGNFGLRCKPGGTGNAIYYDSLTVVDLSTAYAFSTRAKFITKLTSTTKSLLVQAQDFFITRQTTLLGTATNPPPVPHVCVIALENSGYDSSTGTNYVIGNSSFTNINSLRTTYQYATQFYATSHDSLPNYLAFAAGISHDTLANSAGSVPLDTYDPSITPLTDTTLADSFAAAGIGWRHYAENLPSTGYLGADTGSGNTLYVQHHNPWVYYSSIRTSSQKNNIVNLTQLTTDLNNGNAPPFFFVEPDNNHNDHTGTDSACDTYVGALVSQIQASTWYTANNGHIVLWFDESNKPDTAGVSGSDANPGGGHILMVVISEHNKGKTFTSPFNHYGLLRAIEDLYGLSHLGDSANTSNGNPGAMFTVSTPPVVTPTSISPYGVTTQNSNVGVYPYTDALLADCHNIGIGRIRYQQDWANIETAHGLYDFSGLDEIIGKCNAQGFQVCYPIRNAPTWSNTTLINPSQTNHTTCNPNAPNDNWYNMDATATGVFAGVLAARYNGLTTPNPYKSGSFLFLDAIEIGNEDFDIYYDCNSPLVPYTSQETRDPKWYPPVVFAAAPAIKASSPNTLIGQWGMWWKNIDHRVAVLNKLYTTTDTHGKTCASYLDYFNFHCYIQDPSQDIDTENVSLPHIITALENVISGTYHDNKTIRVTEIGWHAFEVRGLPTDPTWAQMAVYYPAAMAEMQSSSVVNGFDFYTMAYSPASGAIADGSSLTNAAGVTPHFQAPVAAIRTYITNNPSWSSTYSLKAYARSKFRSYFTGLKTPAHDKFKTKMVLKGTTRNRFIISDGLKQLIALSLALFKIKIPSTEQPVNDTFTGVDGVDTFTLPTK
jgi:hypothetical protein